MLLVASVGVEKGKEKYYTSTTIQTASSQIIFPVFSCQWIDSDQFRTLLFVSPKVALNHRVVECAQNFIEWVQHRIVLKRKVLAHWKCRVNRKCLQLFFSYWRNVVAAHQKTKNHRKIRRYFHIWLTFISRRRSTLSAVRRALTNLRRNATQSIKTRNWLQMADKHRRRQLLKNPLYYMMVGARQRRKLKNYRQYTILQLQITFLGVYLNQNVFKQVKVAKILSSIANKVNQDPFFYLLRPELEYLSLQSRITVACTAVHESVLKWLTQEQYKDSRPAFNFHFMLKKNQKMENGYLWLQTRFLKNSTEEIGAYVILVHLRTCLEEMKALLQGFQPTELDVRYRDTIFLRELQQLQIQMLQNPGEVETVMQQWQLQHPFYSTLQADQLVRLSLSSLLMTRIEKRSN